MATVFSWLKGIASQLGQVGQQLDAQTQMLQQLLQGQAKEMAAIDDLTTAVDGAVQSGSTDTSGTGDSGGTP